MSAAALLGSLLLAAWLHEHSWLKSDARASLASATHASLSHVPERRAPLAARAAHERRVPLGSVAAHSAAH